MKNAKNDKKGFQKLCLNNQTKEGHVKERNQTAELPFGLLVYFFLVKEMTFVIGNRRAKVKEEREAMTRGPNATK